MRGDSWLTDQATFNSLLLKEGVRQIEKDTERESKSERLRGKKQI